MANHSPKSTSQGPSVLSSLEKAVAYAWLLRKDFAQKLAKYAQTEAYLAGLLKKAQHLQLKSKSAPVAFFDDLDLSEEGIDKLIKEAGALPADGIYIIQLLNNIRELSKTREELLEKLEKLVKAVSKDSSLKPKLEILLQKIDAVEQQFSQQMHKTREVLAKNPSYIGNNAQRPELNNINRLFSLYHQHNAERGKAPIQDNESLVHPTMGMR